MVAVVNVNGRLCGAQDATVSVFDHGFMFGDGVYEVLRTYGREPFLFGAHMRRLRDSAAMIALDVPFTDAELLSRIRETIAAFPGTGECYVRVLLTRGVGEFSYDPKACPTPTLVVIVKGHVPPPEALFEEGVRIALVGVTRNHPGSVNPRIKSNNLLNNALAMQEAIRRGGFEALMKNYKGEIVECSQSNFIVIKQGVAITPPLDAGLLAGGTRAFVLDLARGCGVTCEERPLFEGDLDTADEAFLTSTTREIVPVVRIDDRVIGNGRPGPLTRRLLGEFRARVRPAVTAATPGACARDSDQTN
jgi:branched-chain amino acid aminotransferase